jgi:hypothetical protein
MDEMLNHFSLIFERLMTTPMPPSEPMDGFVATGFTASAFPLCFGMCYTTLATWGLPRTIVTHTVSSSVDAARSMWAS